LEKIHTMMFTTTVIVSCSCILEPVSELSGSELWLFKSLVSSPLPFFHTTATLIFQKNMVTSTCLAASFQRTNVYVLWLLRHSSRLILVKRPYAVSYVPEAGNRSSQRFNFFQKPLYTPNMFWHTLGAEKKSGGYV
jgi:hypothetical protein